MPDPEPFDLTKFNTDPKFQAEREKLDAMNEASYDRIAAKRKKAADEEAAKNRSNLPWPLSIFVS